MAPPARALPLKAVFTIVAMAPDHRSIYGGSFVALALIIVITNITAVPGAIATIVKTAFNGSALAGGAMGTMVVAMQKGIARGIFSNESGLGSAPLQYAEYRQELQVLHIR